GDAGVAPFRTRKPSGQHFGEFDQIPKGVAEESEPAADGGQDERLGDDLDAAATKLGDRLVYARDVETEVVVAAVLPAIAGGGVRAHLGGQRVPAAEHLDVEVVVRGRGEVGELLVGVVPLRDDTEVELLDVEVLRLPEAWRAHCHVVAAHVSEGRGAVLRGRDEVGHGKHFLFA